MFHVKKIRPGEEGARMVLGDLEGAVLEYVWTEGSASVVNAHQHFSKERKIAYNTILTVMTRLCEKQLLIRDKDRRRFIYRPAVTQDEFQHLCCQSMQKCLKRLDRESRALLLEGLFKQLDPEELKSIAAMVKQTCI